MAVCMLMFTRQRRIRCSYIFAVLLLIMISFGVFMLFYSIYIYMTVSIQLFTERAEINFVFTVLAIFGSHVILIYAFGFKMRHKCLYQPFKKSTNKLLCLWYLAGLNTIINLIIICYASKKIKKHIIRTMKHSLEKGIGNYLRDPTWKHTIDRLQYKMKCCGVNGYADWHETDWINEYQINENAELVKQLKSSHGHLHLPVTPWSCCRIDFPMQCLHDPFQQIYSTHLWIDQPDLILNSINTEGCLAILRAPVEFALNILALLVALMFIFNIVLIMLSRLLYTSCRNALLLEDECGLAPGWVFGRGDFGYSRGPTLTEIMANVGETERSSPPTSESANTSPRQLKNALKLFRKPKKGQYSAVKTEESLAASDEETNFSRT